MIKITSPLGVDYTAMGTKFTTADGIEIGGITSASVIFKPDAFVQAEITVMASIDEVWAEPFMSEASFLEAAKRYGYTVSKN